MNWTTKSNFEWSSPRPEALVPMVVESTNRGERAFDEERLDEEPESRRLSQLSDRDIEHCFWRHGHARVFERLAGFRSGPGVSPRRVIDKAIDRHSKPGVAFELLASVAAPGSAGAPARSGRTLRSRAARW